MARTTVYLTDNIAQVKDKLNDISYDIGDLSLMSTSGNDSDVVQAINSLDSDLGTRSTLTTTALNAIAAINEHETDIGSMSLNTAASNLTDAINEHDSELGTVTAAAMGTTASTVGGAIAELEAEIDTLNTKVEPAQALTTTATTLSDAVNELDAELGTISTGVMGTTASTVGLAIGELELEINTLNAKVEPAQALTTSATTLSDAVNELESNHNDLDSDVGNRASLNTASKVNLVAAINEHDTELGTITALAMGTTASTVSTAIKELEVEIDTLNTKVEPAQALTTTATTLSDAINEHDAELGIISAAAMGTTASTVSTAIKELEVEIDTLNSKVEPTQGFSNLVATTLSDAVNELAAMSTDSVSEGSTNFYFTDTRAQDAIIVADAGGLGSIDYTTGTITYTGPSSSDIQGLITATSGSGVSVTNGVIAGNVATTSALGVASYNVADFTINGAGAVSIKNLGVSNAQMVNSGISLGTSSADKEEIELGESVYITGTTNEISVNWDSAANTFTLSQPTNVTTGGNHDVSGNLNVAGTVNVTGAFNVTGSTTNASSHIVVLDDQVGSPVSNGGFAVRRGTADSAIMQWNETNDYWEAGLTTSKNRIITTGDSGVVTNTMLSGSIANNKLANSAITINTTATSLGGSITLNTDNIDELVTPTNKWFTDTRAQSAISVTDNSAHAQLTKVGGVISLAGYSAGDGIDISSTGQISGENASTTNKGIASFSTDNFATSSGVVTIKDGGIVAAELATNAVTTAKINGLAVTGAKIAATTITGGKIAATTITGGKLVNGTITATQIADDTITATQIAPNAITTSELANDAVTAVHVADDAVGEVALKDVVGLVIYSSDGTALKTLYGAGS